MNSKIVPGIIHTENMIIGEIDKYSEYVKYASRTIKTKATTKGKNENMIALLFTTVLASLFNIGEFTSTRENISLCKII